MSVEGSVPTSSAFIRSSREVHEDVAGSVDHVEVRDDVAELVDDEARAERLAFLRPEERALLPDARGHLDDPGRGVPIDPACEASRPPPTFWGCEMFMAKPSPTTVVVPPSQTAVPMPKAAAPPSAAAARSAAKILTVVVIAPSC